MKKLKDLLNESAQMGRVYSNPFATAFVKETEETNTGKMEMTEEQKQAFYEAVRQYKRYGESVYRNEGLSEVYESIKNMVEVARKVTLSETGDWFDNVTVGRHMKRMGESFRVFEKTLKEVSTLQQRLEASYDEIGEVLGKYYEISELNEIEEGNQFGSARAKAIANGDSEFEVDGKTYKVTNVDKEDKENAEKFANESMKLTDMIKKPSVNERIWPKSKLSEPFEVLLDAELKKNFRGIFYVVGKDLYHNDEKVLTINSDKDSVYSIIKSLKSKLKESVNENAFAVIEKNILRAIQMSKYADGDDYLQKMLFGRVIDSLRGNKYIVTKISNIKTKLGKGSTDITITAKVDVVLPDSEQKGTKTFKYTQSNSKFKAIIESVNEAKYDLGMARKGNGLTIYNKAEEDGGDYKNIAHIDNKGNIKLYDKKLPTNIKKMIEKEAEKLKESVNEGKEMIKLKDLLNESIGIGELPSSKLMKMKVPAKDMLKSVNEATLINSQNISDAQKIAAKTKLSYEDSWNVITAYLVATMGLPKALNLVFKLEKEYDKMVSESVNEVRYLDKLSGKELAKRMLKNKIFKPFAKQFAKMKIVTHDDLQNTLPDWVPGKDIQMLFSESINEARLKKVTKQMWAKMDYDERVNALLTFFKDPNDAEEYGDSEWNDLPSGTDGGMYIFESKRTK